MEIMNSLKPKKRMSAPSDVDLVERMSYDKPVQEKAMASEIYKDSLPERPVKPEGASHPAFNQPVEEQIGAMSTTKPVGDPEGAYDEIMAVDTGPEMEQMSPMEGPYQERYKAIQSDIDKEFEKLTDVQGDPSDPFSMTSGSERSASDSAELEHAVDGLDPKTKAEVKRKVYKESVSNERSDLNNLLDKMNKLPSFVSEQELVSELSGEQPDMSRATEEGPVPGGRPGRDPMAGVPQEKKEGAMNFIKTLMSGGGTGGGGKVMDDQIKAFGPFLLGILAGDPGSGAEVGMEELGKQEKAAGDKAKDEQEHADAMEKQREQNQANIEKQREQNRANLDKMYEQAGFKPQEVMMVDPKTGKKVEKTMPYSEYLDRKSKGEHLETPGGSGSGTSNLRMVPRSTPEGTVYDMFDRKTGDLIRTTAPFQAGKAGTLGVPFDQEKAYAVKPRQEYEERVVKLEDEFDTSSTGLLKIDSDNTVVQKQGMKEILKALEGGRLTDFDVTYGSTPYSGLAAFMQEIDRHIKSDLPVPSDVLDGFREIIGYNRDKVTSQMNNARTNTIKSVYNAFGGRIPEERIDRWLGTRAKTHGSSLKKKEPAKEMKPSEKRAAKKAKEKNKISKKFKKDISKWDKRAKWK